VSCTILCQQFPAPALGANLDLGGESFLCFSVAFRSFFVAFGRRVFADAAGRNLLSLKSYLSDRVV